MAITQTYVKGLKKSGEFDDEAKNEALKKAIEESGNIIRGELGFELSTEALTLAVEAELGEQKEVEKVIGGANGPKKFVKKKARKKRS
jgi:23S rRNA pseudoU1915 N3-methylase RlmH